MPAIPYSLSKIRPWAMNSSGCSKKESGPNCATTVSASAAAPRLRLLQLAAPRLRPLQLLLLECVCLLSRTRSTKHNKPTNTLQILLVCMLSDPFAITCSENGGWAYFQGWAFYRETALYFIYFILILIC